MVVLVAPAGGDHVEAVRAPVAVRVGDPGELTALGHQQAAVHGLKAEDLVHPGGEEGVGRLRLGVVDAVHEVDVPVPRPHGDAAVGERREGARLARQLRGDREAHHPVVLALLGLGPPLGAEVLGRLSRDGRERGEGEQRDRAGINRRGHR